MRKWVRKGKDGPEGLGPLELAQELVDQGYTPREYVEAVIELARDKGDRKAQVAGLRLVGQLIRFRGKLDFGMLQPEDQAKILKVQEKLAERLQEDTVQ